MQRWGALFDARAMLAALLPACWGLPRHPAEKTSGEGASLSFDVPTVLSRSRQDAWAWDRGGWD